jgi:predicted Zn-dependent protease with MMP-like domain
MEFRAPLQRARDEGEAGVIEMSRYRFEGLVEAALDEVPGELAAHIDNCVVLVEDDPPPGDPDLLGVYQGTPLTQRGSAYTMALPDRITIFRNPLLEMCTSEEQVVDEVRITVVHEIAHHFGIDDERLHELGYA